MSGQFRTSTVAILIVEKIDGKRTGSCPTHVVLLCLAGEGRRMRIEVGDRG